MCGIAGKTDWKNEITEISSTVKSMTDRLIHRGPDNEGIVNLDSITLGHRRLSIIDLSSKANQPMKTPDGRYHIVYNGEVYNFQEIRNELKKQGVNFQTHSDTEVILNSFATYGTDCFRMFNGMFALAIWDKLKRELILARDRFGKKPLYYYIHKDKNVTFASELTSLVQDRSVPGKISYEALNCYLAIGYILAPMTFYENIFKLEQSSYIIFKEEGNKTEKVQYWNYADTFRTKSQDSEKDIAAKILYLLEESVKRRMISDVPVGAFLSGGIDSSSIVALMKKFHKGELHTFSVGFSQKSYNELPDADRMAQWAGTKHHGLICKVTDGLDFIDKAISAYDEPFSDNSLIPMIEVSKLASAYVTVVLSGDGADEIFAGYITYKADKYYQFAKSIPESFRKLLISFSGTGSSSKKLNWKYKQKQFLNGTLHSADKAHYLWRQFFSPDERANIMGKEYAELINDTDPFYIFKKYYDKAGDLDALDKNLYVDGMTWLADDILVKADRATMHSSIESRSPYLDPELVSYVASIPSGFKMKGFQTKYILKKALKNIIPDFVLNKKKSGFNAPVGSWIGLKESDEFKTFNKYVYDRKYKRTASQAV
ncbi:MAG: asparagine synthase (glutamine-hydrolyzing) [Ignavibacteria bacterium]|nr:asparagine synthase (glutamine-hydrolyzing) [Ignavibacteria bacterium]